MAYITRNKAIEVNGKIWWVNSAKSGLISHTIKAMINQIDAMLSHHSKVILIRFDLRLYEYTENNGIMTTFNRKLHKRLKRKYNFKHIGFMWCRELETSKNQHYHYALMIDGHKVDLPYGIIAKIEEILQDLDCSVFFPTMCFYRMKRDDHQSIQDAIWRISYIAKSRGKGYKPSQTKNHGTSRIKLNC